MNIARIHVSYEMLELALRLPAGAHIVRIVDDADRMRSFFVTVVGPMYPEVPECWDIPVVAHEAAL